MNNIPTAEEFVNRYDWENSTLDIPSVLIEFAKLHLEKQADIISNLDFDSIVHTEADSYKEAVRLTILECYSLANVK